MDEDPKPYTGWYVLRNTRQKKKKYIWCANYEIVKLCTGSVKKSQIRPSPYQELCLQMSVMYGQISYLPIISYEIPVDDKFTCFIKRQHPVK